MKKKLFAATAGAIAAIVFWRRKTIKDDAAKVTQASKGAAAKAAGAGKGVATKATQAGKGVGQGHRGRQRRSRQGQRAGRGRATTASGEELPAVDTLDLRNDGESAPRRCRRRPRSTPGRPRFGVVDSPRVVGRDRTLREVCEFARGHRSR